MDRFCIFCGKKPESKSREHVIPLWLIALTGDTNRNVHLGKVWGGHELEERRYSFDNYVFPACEHCNTEFSDLEARAKLVLESILNKCAICADEWDVFLDWLGKVRIGLWLGELQLNGNHGGIEPCFHIKQRMGSKDRFVIVYEIIEDGFSGVTWTATNTRLFEYIPSCFCIMINTFMFFNVSSDFLLAKDFGFPYPVAKQLMPDDTQRCVMSRGTCKVDSVALADRVRGGGTGLFQPIVPVGCLRNELELQLYDVEYMRGNCAVPGRGKGNIFGYQGGNIARYPSERSLDWLPDQRFPRRELLYRITEMAWKTLEALYEDGPTLELLGRKEAQHVREERKWVLRLHRAIVDRCRRTWHSGEQDPDLQPTEKAEEATN